MSEMWYAFEKKKKKKMKVWESADKLFDIYFFLKDIFEGKFSVDWTDRFVRKCRDDGDV